MPDENAQTETQTTETPEWTKDPLYANVVSNLDPKLIRTTPAETLAEIGKAHKAAVEHMSKTRKVEPEVKPETKTVETKQAPETPLSLTPEETETPSEKGIAAILSAAGLKGKEPELLKAWRESGELTAEQYAALEKAGWSRDDADPLIESVVSRIEKPIKAALEIAGGQEAFQTMRVAAQANMPKDLMKRIDEQFKTAPETAMLALMGWYQNHTGTSGGRIISGDRGGTGGYAEPKTLAEFSELVQKARRGDKAAEAAVLAFRKHNDIRNLK